MNFENIHFSLQLTEEKKSQHKWTNKFSEKMRKLTNSLYLNQSRTVVAKLSLAPTLPTFKRQLNWWSSISFCVHDDDPYITENIFSVLKLLILIHKLTENTFWYLHSKIFLAMDALPPLNQGTFWQAPCSCTSEVQPTLYLGGFADMQLQGIYPCVTPNNCKVGEKNRNRTFLVIKS